MSCVFIPRNIYLPTIAKYFGICTFRSPTRMYNISTIFKSNILMTRYDCIGVNLYNGGENNDRMSFAIFDSNVTSKLQKCMQMLVGKNVRPLVGGLADILNCLNFVKKENHAASVRRRALIFKTVVEF